MRLFNKLKFTTDTRKISKCKLNTDDFPEKNNHDGHGGHDGSRFLFLDDAILCKKLRTRFLAGNGFLTSGDNHLKFSQLCKQVLDSRLN